MPESSQSLLNGFCHWCGIGSQIFVKVIVRVPDADAEYPYVETAYCKRHWDEFGIDAAMEFAGLNAKGESG